MSAFVSARPARSLEYLAETERSLLAQAGAVPGRFQDDGWGTAWFTPAGKISLVRSVRPAREDAAAFRAAAGKARSRVTVSHLRDASNPLKVRRSLLISRENTQPFSAGGYVFCHNGTLFIKDEVRAALGKRARDLKGTNDSEVLFRQVLKMLDVYGDPARALEMAVDEIRTIWTSCRDKYPGREAPYRGLNMFLASREGLTVLCHGDSRRGALMTPGWDFGSIAWRCDGAAAVFSSEPLDARPGWKKLKDRQLAEARIAGGRVSIKIRNADWSSL